MPTKKIILPSHIDLDHFISVQAHDLRTPFNHVIGFSKMTLNTVGDAPLTNFQKEDLGTVYRSGLRALSMMNGLIDIARINLHEKEPNPTNVNIEQMIEQSLAQWKKFSPGSDVQTETHIMTSSTELHVDEQLIRQVVTGFVTYVAHYCEAKAKVTITVEEEPNWFIFTFTCAGTKARLPSELDLEMLGYINRTFIELNAGEIRRAEENDEGAIIQFALPKVKIISPK
jgi:signal transduction histidine kinase